MFEIVKMLLDKGADPNAKGGSLVGSSDTPFCNAAIETRSEMLALMIQKKADVNQPCVMDAPAVYTTTDPKTARVLLNAGMKVEVGRLFMACENPQILRMLISSLAPDERRSAVFITSTVCGKR
jgi:hypothetical protein